jgi:hypothetical protein
LVCCAGFLIQAQPAAPDVAPRFTITGTSTIRGWSCPAEGTIEVTPGQSSQPVPGFPGGVAAVVMTVPVGAIACEDEEMVAHLRDAFQHEAESAIVYRLERYELTGEKTATATGTMTIDGVTKPIDLEVTFASSPQGLRTEGTTIIDMTQFNVTPPEVWLGLLKVGKDVQVTFEAILAPSP